MTSQGHQWNDAWRGAVLLGADYDWCRVTGAANAVLAPIDFHAVREYTVHLAGNGRIGNHLKPYRLAGFNGYSMGQCSVAIRDPLVLVEMRGGEAYRLVTTEYDRHRKCTRLDIAVDVLMPLDRPWIAQVAYDTATEYQRRWPRKGRPPSLKLICSPNGDTFYVGKRGVGKMIRLYDKTRELKLEGSPPMYIWRIELELCKETADAIYHRVAGRTDGLLYLRNAIFAYMAYNGLPVPFEGDANAVLPSVVRSATTDNERTLAWLNRNVGRSVRRLLDQGMYNEVVHALGMG